MPTSLSVGAVTVDLTPRKALPMGGFEGAPRLTRRAHGKLEANIVVLGDGNDIVILIALDTLFAGAALTKQITDACARRFDVDPGRVLVLASHTHFAPMLDASKPLLGETDPAEVIRWGNATTAALGRVAAQQVTSIRIGIGISAASVNRRLRWRLPSLARLLGKAAGDVYLCDNPKGQRDARIRTCVWLSEDDRPVAAFWSFACHPVWFPDSDTASADYIGVVRDSLRARLDADIPVIFAPGCMGDVWPVSPAPWLTMRRILRIAIFGPNPPSYDRKGWDMWAKQLAEEVCAADAEGVTRTVASRPRAADMVRFPISEILDGTCPVPEMHGKAIRAPGLGRVIALSSEPVAAIAGLIAGCEDDIVLGYEGDVFGYLPTDAQIREGGYEAKRFMKAFGLTGAFIADLDAKIIAVGNVLRP